MGLRSQSVSPTGGMSSSVTSQEKRSEDDASVLAIPKPSKDDLTGLLKAKKSKAPGRDQEGAVDEVNIMSDAEPRGVPSNAVKCPVGQEEQENRDSLKHGLATDLSSNLLTGTLETVSKEVEEAVLAIPTAADTQSVMSVSAVAITQVGKASSLVDTAQGSQEVWETVIDSGCSSQINSKGLGFQGHAALKHEVAGKDNIHSSIEKESKEVGTDAQFENRVGSKPKDATSALSELGFEVEDISENEEEIEPGQGKQL